MSTHDPEAAYQAAEAQLRAFYTQTTAKYRATRETCDWESVNDACFVPESAWTEHDQEILAELRDKAADAALALLQARGWFPSPGATTS